MGRNAVVSAGMLTGSLMLCASSLAQASCSCSAPAPPDPVAETAAKIILMGALVALAGYRYYRRRPPTS